MNMYPIKEYKVIKWVKTGKNYPALKGETVKTFNKNEYLNAVKFMQEQNRTAVKGTHFTINEVV